MKMFRKRDEGFTLVELMVVVLIIGILLAIAIPVFNAAKARAERRACYSNQRNIEGAFQTYRASEEVSPTTMSDLVPNYIKEAPTCPTTGAGYTFDASGTVADCATHGHY
ncbi:MAG: hypothetical protein Kow0056_00440 [Coriobacteriia bacterium]